MASAISIVIVDDHPVVLDGVAEFLRASPEFRVLATCRDTAHALEEIWRLQPDLAILDFRMPGLDGLGLFRRMKADQLRTKVLFFSSAPTDAQICTAVAEGASGILLKDASMDELLQALKSIAAGAGLTPSGFVQEAMQRNEQRLARAQFIRQTLTAREREILQLMAEGLSDQGIAGRLWVSRKTVETHVRHILRKLELPLGTAHNRRVHAVVAQLNSDAAVAGGGSGREQVSHLQRTV